MNAKLAKILSIILAVVIIVSSVFTIVSFATGSLLTKKLTSNEVFDEEYALGSYTSDVVIDEISFGIMDIVDIINNFHLIRLVMSTQTHEGTIRNLTEDLEEVVLEYTEYKLENFDEYDTDYYKNRCEDYEDRIKDINDQIEDENDEFNDFIDENYVDSDFEDVEVALNDESFLNGLGTIYIISSLFDIPDEGQERETSTNGYVFDEDELEDYLATIVYAEEADYPFGSDNYGPTIIKVVGGICIGLFVIMSIISMIVLLVFTIKRLIKLIINAIKSDDPLAIMGKADNISACITPLVMAVLVKAFYGTELVIGNFIHLAVISALITAACFMIIRLLSGKIRVFTLVKTLINAATLVLAALILNSALSVGIINTATAKVNSFEEDIKRTEYVEELKEALEDEADELEKILLNEGLDAYEDEMSRIRANSYTKAVRDYENNILRFCIICGLVLMISILACIMFGVSVARFAMQKVEYKDGTEDDYGASIASPIILLVVCIAIGSFTVSTNRQFQKSAEDNKYSVFVGEYAVEDSVDYEKYTALEEEIEDLEDAIDELEDEIDDADDDDEELALIALRDNCQRKINADENYMAVLRESDFSASSIITLAAIYLVLEIGYLVVTIIEKKKKALPAAETKEAPKAESAPVAEVETKAEPTVEPAPVVAEEPVAEVPATESTEEPAEEPAEEPVTETAEA